MQYHIEGMDCASCVGKIERALIRMPGVSGVQLNFATQKLELILASDAATDVKDIEKTIKRLGFGISALNGQQEKSSTDESQSAIENQRWWQTIKGKQVIGTGILMSAAYMLSLIFPEYGAWVFIAAVAIGVLPFARKAFALALVGSPFQLKCSCLLRLSAPLSLERQKKLPPWYFYSQLVSC